MEIRQQRLADGVNPNRPHNPPINARKTTPGNRVSVPYTRFVGVNRPNAAPGNERGLEKDSDMDPRLIELIRLHDWITHQIYIETCRPNYIGTQRAIAYRRVLARLEPLISKEKSVKKE